jgi:hypothetical protein
MTSPLPARAALPSGRLHQAGRRWAGSALIDFQRGDELLQNRAAAVVGLEQLGFFPGHSAFLIGRFRLSKMRAGKRREVADMRGENREASVSTERRTRQRFPLDLEIRFKATMRRRPAVEGQGRVVDISSQGIAFQTATPLSTGMSVQASMAWPVALNGDCPLRMAVDGHVVRARPGLVVMSIGKYEFKTGGKPGAPQRAQLEQLARGLGDMSAGEPRRA